MKRTLSKFHFISLLRRAIGISTNSTEEVGRIYLEAVRKHAPDFRPTAYLGDAAEAFANAALGIFVTILIRLMCFAHVYKVLIGIHSDTHDVCRSHPIFYF
jgi:hypothetical protein